MPGPGREKRKIRIEDFKEGFDREFSSKVHTSKAFPYPHVDLHVFGPDGKIDKKKSKDGFRVEGW